MHLRLVRSVRRRVVTPGELGSAGPTFPRAPSPAGGGELRIAERAFWRSGTGTSRSRALNYAECTVQTTRGVTGPPKHPAPIGKLDDRDWTSPSLRPLVGHLAWT